MLFFLSVTAPRGWQRDVAAQRANKPDAAQPLRNREPANQAVILHAQPVERDNRSTAPPDSALHPQALGDNLLFHGASANAASPPEAETPAAEPIGADIQPSPPIARDAPSVKSPAQRKSPPATMTLRRTTPIGLYRTLFWIIWTHSSSSGRGENGLSASKINSPS